MKQVIKKNNYKYRYNLKKKDEILGLLGLTLKEYFSEEISSKYDGLKYPSNYNELIIDKLLEDENNKDIFELIFNELNIEDYLDIFLYKKDLEEFNKFKSLNENQRNKIKDNMIRFDKFINKIYKKGKIYFHCFSLIIYNLKRFLSLKESRNRNQKDKKED